MTTPDGAGNGFTVSLKDVYDAQASMESKLTESFAELRVTLTKIQAHMDSLDQSSAASTLLHAEHGRRLSDLERVIDVTGVKTMRDERQRYVDDFERRIRVLENDGAGSAAVRLAQASAVDAARRSRAAFWGMVGALAGAVSALVAMTVLLLTHH